MIEHRHLDRADHAADGRMEGAHVKLLVEREIGAQQVEHRALRLERQNLPARPDELCQVDSVGADIRAGLDDRLPRTEQLLKQNALGFAELAVEVEGAADELVVRQIQHSSVAALSKRGGG